MFNKSRKWAVSPSGVMAWSRFLPGLKRRLSRPPLKDLSRVRRLGVLRPDGMGDLLLTSGMLRELRRQLPNARITLICQTQWAAWMRTCPWVDEVIDVEMSSDGFHEWKRVSELSRFVKRVWPLDLEVLVQPGTLFWYAPSRTLALFSGAPVRLCWEDPDAGVDTGATLHTHTFPYPNAWHETEKCFRMLEAMGLQSEERRLATWWTAEDSRRGNELAAEARRSHLKLVALGLAASESHRRWPRERFLDVIREVGAARDVAFLAFGGPDVAETCKWLAKNGSGLVTYAGDDVSLGTVWSAIANCDLYLGNDTGLMHMAAAAGVPVVVVNGIAATAPLGTRGHPSHTGPYGVISRIVQPPPGTSRDSELNVALIASDAVTRAALELLS
jgi:ADP-heptose:LPS heptosyltransferase